MKTKRPPLTIAQAILFFSASIPCAIACAFFDWWDQPEYSLRYWLKYNFGIVLAAARGESI